MPPRACYLLNHENGPKYHQQTVSHIRHHNAVKQDKKRRHQRVWVQLCRTPAGNTFPLPMFMQRVSFPFFSATGTWLYSSGRRVLQRIGAVKCGQKAAPAFQSFPLGPSRPDTAPAQHSTAAPFVLSVATTWAIRSMAICNSRRRGPRARMASTACWRWRCVLLHLRLNPLEVLRHCAGQLLHLRKAETIGTQGLQSLLLTAPVAQDLQAVLLAPCGEQGAPLPRRQPPPPRRP